jgi:hypothetical protein
MSDEPQTPSLADVIRTAMEARIDTIYTALPGRILAFDRGAQTCDVRPMVEQAYHDEFGERKTTALPVITGVPVLFPGGGGTRIVWDLHGGDGCLIVFSSSSLEGWRKSDGQGFTDSGNDYHHSLNDAIVIPGLFTSRDSRTALTPTVEDALVVYADDLRLGDESATSPVALKSDLQLIITAIDAASVLCLAELPPNTAGSTALLALKNSLQLLSFPTCATKVKAK